MRLSLKERKFIFLPTFSLPSSLSLLKVPNDTAGALNVQMKSVLKMVSCWSPNSQAVYIPGADPGFFLGGGAPPTD